MESPRSMNGHSSPEGMNGLSADDISSIQSSIRFLVSNAAAGSIIGKGGSNISELQSQSGARIQLSRNYEYFPGTTDRVVVLNGTVSEVLTAFKLILTKTTTENNESQDAFKSNQVRLLVPNSVCGAIIGKGGATIKTFIEDSQANIKLSSQEQILSGLSDRIVMITGNLEQQVRAAELVLGKVSPDSSYAQYGNAPLSYAGTQNPRNTFASLPIATTGYGVPVMGPIGAGNIAQSKGIMSPLVPLQAPFRVTLPLVQAGSHTTTTSIEVLDEHIGALVGRGGKTINEIQQNSGVKIKISNRGDFVPGTKNRKVTLMGTAAGVQIAQHLVAQRLQQIIASDIDK
ncbi:hypothetical protein O6H91_19G026100 [Diphasiastrum complanatum]|uniref:Uncharacterized protein n=1 Tax=Diphasiastrum complanatum TaxID=34168 RepID=A0ACC2ATJ9_DIPCM|nr:hypothetical protein O6H91_19G026100 [Diphasiastrum complanatum]